LGGLLDVRFTLPVKVDSNTTVDVTQYDYDYWWEYGSPERHVTQLPASLLIGDADADQRSLGIIIPNLDPGHMVRVRLHGLHAIDGTPLLHDEFAYTLNQLPGAPHSSDYIAKLVPPPPARESGDEGWLFLTYTDALGRWNSKGWILCDAELD